MDLQAYYDSIDLDKIDDFINSQREEDLHLDFKRMNDPKLNRDDRKNLAIALSGFANSDGGIIVWGVDARPNSDGINCAISKEPIRSIKLTISKLNEFTGSHVNPSVDGVIHKPIEAGEDTGYAVTLIPASDSTPHMAKGGEDRYYKRSGDRFNKMEHFEIEDMFGRRPKPVLSLSHRVIKGLAREGEVLSFQIILGLMNDGKGFARAPYLSIRLQGPCRIFEYGIDGNRREGLPRLITVRDSEWQSYGGSSDKVIYPGMNLDILALTGKFDPDKPFNDQVIDYHIAAEGISLISDTLRIEVNALISEIRKAWRS